MRLINANDVAKYCCEYYNICGSHCNECKLTNDVNKIPTAYDVDEVVEELENNYLVFNDGDWNKAIDRAIEIVKDSEEMNETKQNEYKWITINKELPKEQGYYLTSTMYEQVFCDYWNGKNFGRSEMVVCWQPLPEPYKIK